MNADILQELRKPLPPHAVGFRPADNPDGKKRVRCHAYLTARTAMERLDVADPEWTATFQSLGSPSMWECHLTVRGVTRSDVGEGPNVKSARSDALKRAAVQFGVGRFLYELPSFFVDEKGYWMNKKGKVGGLTRGGVRDLHGQYQKGLAEPGIQKFGEVADLAGVWDEDRHVEDVPVVQPSGRVKPRENATQAAQKLEGIGEA